MTETTTANVTVGAIREGEIVRLGGADLTVASVGEGHSSERTLIRFEGDRNSVVFATDSLITRVATVKEFPFGTIVELPKNGHRRVVRTAKHGWVQVDGPDTWSHWSAKVVHNIIRDGLGIVIFQPNDKES